MCALPMRFATRRDPWAYVERAHAGGKLHIASTEDEIAARIDGIVCQAVAFLDVSGLKPRAAVFEQYALNQHGAFSRQIAEVAGALKRELYRRDVPIYSVAASSARKLLLGANPTRASVGMDAKKFVGRIIEQMGGPFATHDEADAFVVANWMVAQLGGVAFAMTREQVAGMMGQ